MKKMKFLIGIFLIGNCLSTFGRNYWPYSNISPQKVQSQKLIEYDDCLHFLDDILTKEVKEHFSNQDSTIATIEICDEIDGFFITNWKLNRYGETKGTTAWGPKLKLPKKPENVPAKFIYDGIEHPKAMIRVIFNCYYKYLNGMEYDWEYEIEKLKSYWVNPDVILYYAVLPDKMKVRENHIMNSYYYNLMEVNDTVVCLWRQPPKLFSKTPSWFYATGIVSSKIEEGEGINVKIIAIDTEFDKQAIYFEADTVYVGDTIPEYAIDWHKSNYRYFDYHNNKYYPASLNPLKNNEP
jgi:hypothetical protein